MAEPFEFYGFVRTRRVFGKGLFFPQPKAQRSEMFLHCVVSLSQMPRTSRIEQQRRKRCSACTTSAGLAGQPNGAWMLLLAV